MPTERQRRTLDAPCQQPVTEIVVETLAARGVQTGLHAERLREVLDSTNRIRAMYGQTAHTTVQ